MIAIGCTQHFEIAVTKDLVDGLVMLGMHHYDGTCQQSVRCGQGGFIYGWKNSLDWLLSQEQPPLTEYATNRELQICLKICESLPYSRMLITAEQFKACQQFTRFGYAALRQADNDPRFKESILVML